MNAEGVDLQTQIQCKKIIMNKSKFDRIILLIKISSASAGLIGFCFSLFFSFISSSYGQSPEASEDKKVIINFDDGFKSQIVKL
jgi:hypothetical protein